MSAGIAPPAASLARSGLGPPLGEQAMSDAQLEAEVCTLAGHLAAATARFLLLLAELDRREAWAGVGIRSLAHWLSWRCGIAPVTAREQVRVARALAGLPRVAAAFAAGRLSYSKVRAITRVADPASEAALVELALAGTAAHVERVVAGTNRARSLADEQARHTRRHLSPRWDDDGTLVATLRLSPDEGAAVLAALHRVQAGLARGADGAPTTHRPSLADALVALAEHALAATAPDPPGSAGPEVMITVDEAVLRSDGTGDDGCGDGDAPAADADGAGGGRQCRVVDGPGLHPDTARRLSCDGPTTQQTRGPGESTLDLGRRRRRPGPRLLRALWLRDGGCRFPGCGRRIWVHAHHLRHWAHGGRTDLANLVLLCGTHHRLLHEGGYTVAVPAPHTFVFCRPDGGRVDEAPPMAGDPWAAAAGHHASIDADTTTPTWRGEPLHLDHAVSAVLAGKPDQAA